MVELDRLDKQVEQIAQRNFQLRGWKYRSRDNTELLLLLLLPLPLLLPWSRSSRRVALSCERWDAAGVRTYWREEAALRRVEPARTVRC